MSKAQGAMGFVDGLSEWIKSWQIIMCGYSVSKNK